MAPSSSRGLREIPDSYQVVHGRGEDEQPPHPGGAPMPELPREPDRLQPTEDLPHQFPVSLAHRILRVLHRSPIEDSRAPRQFLGHVVRDLVGLALPVEVAS